MLSGDAPQMHLEEVPRWVGTLPFVGAILLLLLTQLIVIFVGGELEAFAKAQIAAGPKELDQNLPVRLTGEELRKRFEWQVDIVQSATSFLTPVFGLAILYLTSLRSGAIFFFLVVPVGSLAFTFHLLTVGPGKYRNRAWKISDDFSLSFVTWAGLILNTVGALLVLLTAPETAAVIRT